jgi:hypothetical protein
MGFMDEKLKEWEENAARTHRAMLPLDYDLWDQAEKSMGHISQAAVTDEYDRLLAIKLKPKPGLLARLFGR